VLRHGIRDAEIVRTVPDVESGQISRAAMVVINGVFPDIPGSWLSDIVLWANASRFLRETPM
jgi:hypothetical protein